MEKIVNKNTRLPGPPERVLVSFRSLKTEELKEHLRKRTKKLLYLWIVQLLFTAFVFTFSPHEAEITFVVALIDYMMWYKCRADYQEVADEKNIFYIKEIHAN